MTASKSSRARNARAQRIQGAQGGATRTGTAVKNGAPVKAGTGVKNGTAAKVGTTVKNGTGVKDGPVKNGTAVKDGPVKNGTAVKAETRVKAGAVRAGSQGGSADLDATSPATWTVPLWLQLTTFFFALAGLGVSIYLTIAHFTESTLAGCSETSGLVNCTKVTTSPQSYVFGIPVAVLGLAFYVFAAAIMSPWAWRWARREVYLLRLASVVVGIGFVIYLIYAELFIIGSICLYCTSVHAITFIIFGLTAFAAAAWGLPGRRQAA
jgi:uncharacterized membrane protein